MILYIEETHCGKYTVRVVNQSEDKDVILHNICLSRELTAD